MQGMYFSEVSATLWIEVVLCSTAVNELCKFSNLRSSQRLLRVLEKHASES